MNELTPEQLEAIAEWLDIYDSMAETFLGIKLLESDLAEMEEVKKALATVRGKSVQDDLRRWAAEMREREESIGECDACSGTALPLNHIPRESYGQGPASSKEHHLCDVCYGSFSVSRWLAGFTMSAGETDVLKTTNMILGEIRGLRKSLDKSTQDV